MVMFYPPYFNHAPQTPTMTKPHPNSRILVFAKAPIAGTVKTRLIPTLGAQRAAALQGALIRHTLATTEKSHLPVELWCHPNPGHPLFETCSREFPLTLHSQEGGDLGARMYHAACEGLAAGPVILIGTDCPALTAEVLIESAAALERGNDAVLGPALDGGYYLLGLRRIDPSLFTDIPWGTDGVLERTRRQLRILGWKWQENPTKCDIDRADDLSLLPATLQAYVSSEP